MLERRRNENMKTKNREEKKQRKRSVKIAQNKMRCNMNI